MEKAVSIKKNFLYSGFLTTANYLFTFITYPYVSRVLGVDKIGTVNFIDSVINYFIMLSMLGITIVGIREIAKAKSCQEELDSTYSSILSLNAILTLIATLILAIGYLLVPQLNQHGNLLAFGAVKLFANMFLLDWVVKGLEDFRIITLRTFAIRMLYVVAVLLFVKTPEDYTTYYLLTAVVVVMNALINVIYLRRFVNFSIRKVNIRLFVVPVCTLGLYMVFTSFYNTFNVMFLGIYAGETEVGYYTTATKIFTILISLFTAFCGVMLPRMSNLLAEGKHQEYRLLLDKSITLLYIFSIPIVLFSEVFANDIVFLISGKGYEGAILPMRVCLPLLVIIGHSQILLQQGLMPLGKDKSILVTSVIGGLLALSLILLLIPTYKSLGSALLWVLSEVGVNITTAIYLYNYIGVPYPFGTLMKMFAANLPLLLILYQVTSLEQNVLVRLILGGFVTTIYSIVLQCYVFKDDTIRKMLRIRN